MNKFFNKITIIISLIAIILAGSGIFYIYNRESSSSIDYIVAEKIDLVQEVSVTGRVKPAQSVQIGFEGAGQVISVLASVGDSVYKGQLLVQLKNGENKADLAKAEATVKLEMAKLDELIHGSTSEEIEIQRIKVANAESSLTEVKRNLTVKLGDAFTKSDDAVRNNVDQFISNPRGSNPQINFSIADSNLESAIEFMRFSVELILNAWQNSVGTLTVESDLIAEAGIAKQNLANVKEFLDKISLGVNALTASSNFSQATINSYRSDVSAARTNINTAISNLSSALEKLQIAESALALEVQELMLKTAGTRSEQIRAQEAKIEEAEAAVLSRQAEIDKTYLIAPISGIVTVQEAKVGEIITAGKAVVSIISEAEFEIEARVPEADIAKININDPAEITLDAYRGDILFRASVVSIDPAETIIEGVATYKTILQFNEKDERVRSGMTANIDIKTGERLNVVAIPARAVITKNSNKIVRVINDKNVISEVQVTTGLKDSDGYIEITSGVNEGDKVVVFLEQ